jgi:hypothetical protein
MKKKTLTLGDFALIFFLLFSRHVFAESAVLPCAQKELD